MLNASIARRALATMLVLAGGSAGSAQAQVAVSDLEISLNAAQAGERAGAVTVTNTTGAPIQILIDVQDWDRSTLGENRYYPLGTLDQSCRGDVSVFPLSMRLEAGESQPLRVTYSGGADRSCWAIVFVQADQSRDPSVEGAQVSYVIRTGVKVYVEPAGAVRSGDIVAMQFVEPDSTGRAIAIEFANSGAAHLMVRGAVEIRDEHNQVAANIEIPEFPVVPGATRISTIALPALTPGRYVGLALLDYRGDEIAAGQVQFAVE